MISPNNEVALAARVAPNGRKQCNTRGRPAVERTSFAGASVEVHGDFFTAATRASQSSAAAPPRTADGRRDDDAQSHARCRTGVALNRTGARKAPTRRATASPRRNPSRKASPSSHAIGTARITKWSSSRKGEQNGTQAAIAAPSARPDRSRIKRSAPRRPKWS